jgi:hypothetical protein
MEHLWTGRRMTVDLIADVAAGKSVNFALIAASERAQGWLRQRRNLLRSGGWLPARRKSLASTGG